MEEKFVDIKEEEKQTMQYPKDKKQTMIYKAKLKIEQQKLQYNQEWATVFRKGNQFPLHLCMVSL